MDPFPYIQCAFFLVIQEEKQREVGNVKTPIESQFACVVQGSQNSKSGNKKANSRPLCACCSPLDNPRTSASRLLDILQVTSNTRAWLILSITIKESLQTLSNIAQCQQLLNFIQSQMARPMKSETSQSDQSNLGMIYSTLGLSYDIKSSSWIIDSGGTSHICHDLKLFDQYTLLSNRIVTLPNN